MEIKSTVLRALIVGVAVAIWLFGSFSILSSIITETPKGSLRALTGLLGLIILFTGIFYAIKKARKKSPGNTIRYWQAVKIGVTISVITAIIVSLTSFFYLKIINPDFSNDMVLEAQQALTMAGKNQTAIAEELEKVKSEFSIGNQMMQALIGQSVFGSAFALIISLFLKKEIKKI